MVVAEALARWFYRLRDYPSSLGGDEEGDGGYPPSEGPKGRWDGSSGYIESDVSRSQQNMAAGTKLMLNTL